MRRSLRYAVVLAGSYAAFAAAYIVVSSRLAARQSASVEDLARIETLKGIVYVAVTALGVFLLAWALLARLERSQEQVRARETALLAMERRGFAGLLAASIAHDANNVLTSVVGDLHLVRKSLGTANPNLSNLQISVDRLIALNGRLVATARQGRVTTGHLDLARVVPDLLAGLQTLEPVRRCRVELESEQSAPVVASVTLLQQIVANLIVNAGEATGGRGRILVRVTRDADAALLEVHDNGPGLPAGRRAGIFEALATTKPDGNGLGLFSVQACAKALGGSAEVDDSPLGGACFRVRLPAKVPAQETKAAG